MGQAVLAAAEQNPNVTVIATHDDGEALEPLLDGVDAVIDFSHHTFTAALLAACAHRGIPVVIGTTGHTDEERAKITETAQALPIVFAPNFSIGVNTLFWLTRKATEILSNFDIEVVEMHHRHKIDSPSGTARRLLEIITEETHRSLADDVVYGREGNIGPRQAKEIGMHALRGGDVVGDHTVIYATDGERVELTHKASSRLTFASGAVRASEWLAGQKPGLYDMQDVLGLK